MATIATEESQGQINKKEISSDSWPKTYGVKLKKKIPINIKRLTQ